jgi:four helix bundle protein
MAKINSFRDLEVWQVAMTLVVSCYDITASLPKSELYSLTSQLRRAATSIVANVAEGHNRRSRRAYLYHVDVALGSQAELETLLEVACRLRYVVADDVRDVMLSVERVGRMRHGLARALDRGNVLPERPAPSPERP